MYFNPRTHVGCDKPRGLPSEGFLYFNPRTHVGCDFRKGTNSVEDFNFNPRTHVGCDTTDDSVGVGFQDFNPRTHVGCDGTRGRCARLLAYFNPRTHVGCDVREFLKTLLLLFQSTHPRGVRQTKIAECEAAISISIHAPTWGATKCLCEMLVAYGYFNPRTHVGCDEALWVAAWILPKFQSTHPRGVRQTKIAECEAAISISIHAPTWGATKCLCEMLVAYGYFNPRTHVGCDEALWVAAWILPKFQSTHPRGVRLNHLQA